MVKLLCSAIYILLCIGNIFTKPYDLYSVTSRSVDRPIYTEYNLPSYMTDFSKKMADFEKAMRRSVDRPIFPEYNLPSYMTDFSKKMADFETAMSRSIDKPIYAEYNLPSYLTDFSKKSSDCKSESLGNGIESYKCFDSYDRCYSRSIEILQREECLYQYIKCYECSSSRSFEKTV